MSFFFLFGFRFPCPVRAFKRGEKTSDSPVGAVELGARGLGDLLGGGLAALDGAAHGGGLLRVKKVESWKGQRERKERGERVSREQKEERRTLQG